MTASSKMRFTRHTPHKNINKHPKRKQKQLRWRRLELQASAAPFAMQFKDTQAIGPRKDQVIDVLLVAGKLKAFKTKKTTCSISLVGK